MQDALNLVCQNKELPSSLITLLYEATTNEMKEISFTDTNKNQLLMRKSKQSRLQQQTESKISLSAHCLEQECSRKQVVSLYAYRN